MVIKYDENFVFTALPAGITGTKLRIAVLVTPRVGSDDPAHAPATLDNWPDVRDWPTIAPSWKVTIEKGNTDHILDATEVKPEPYDMASWQALFPGSATATPYKATDKSQAPIFSYPVKTVVEAAKDLHTTALRYHRTGFPSVIDLQETDTFQRLKDAANPNYEAEILCSQYDGPVPDSNQDVTNAFVMGAGFHGVRPCSEQDDDTELPQVDSVSPTSVEIPGGATVTVSGTHFTSSCRVVIDGTDATANVVNNAGTEIKCKVPSRGVGTYDLLVREFDRLSNTIKFSYYKGPA